MNGAFLFERLKEFAYNSIDNKDIEYLKNEKIGSRFYDILDSIITRGLTELIDRQPKNPITFLGKWLLNEVTSDVFAQQVYIV